MVQPRGLKARRGMGRDLLQLMDNTRDAARDILEEAREEREERRATIRWLQDRLRRAEQRHRQTTGQARARAAQSIHGITQRLRELRRIEAARRREFEQRYPRY